MKKMLFIYNPRSGKGEIRHHLFDILEEFAAQEYEITIHPTTSTLDAQKTIMEQASHYDVLVCSGGDGTLDEVVSGMIMSGVNIPVGYIPAGSTNDFANSIGIPKQMRKAASIIGSGEIFRCDVGQMNDDYFVYVAAFGVFTDVSYRTSQDVKNILGHGAYLLEGVKSLSAIKGWNMRVESPEYSGEGTFVYGMITNSNSVGGIKGLTGRDVTLDDGLFEVTLIRETKDLVELVGMINSVLLGEKNDNILTFKTSEVTFYSEEEIPWTRDGEFGGDCRTVHIKNIPKALPIIVETLYEGHLSEEEEEWQEE